MSISSEHMGQLARASIRNQSLLEPNAAVAPAGQRNWDRRFVSAQNLKPDQSFANLFQSIQPSAKQLKTYIDNGLELEPQAPLLIPQDNKPAKSYADLFTLKPSDTGRLSIDLVSVKSKKFDKSAEAQAYNAFHNELKDSEEASNAQRSNFQRLFDRVKNAFKSEPKLVFERKDVPTEPHASAPHADASNPPAPAQAAPTQDPNFRDATWTVTTSDMKPEAKEKLEGHLITNSTKEDFKDRSKIWKIAFGVAFTAGLVAMGFVLAPLLSIGLVVGGTAVMGLVLSKALNHIRSPWWHKTLEGQIQTKERNDAVEIGRKFSDMVRQQSKLDNFSEHGLSMPEEGNIRSEVIPEGDLKDFMAIAKKYDSTKLKAAVKKHLLDKSTSHLDTRTIDNSKKSNWFRIFTGNSRGEAKKTIDIVADHITKGIMRGIALGTVDTISDELTRKLGDRGQAAVKANLLPTQEAFRNAIFTLIPDARGFQLMDVKGIFDDTEQYNEVSKNARQNLTAEIKKGENCVYGLANAKSFVDELDRLDHALVEQKASLDQVAELVGKKALNLGDNNAIGTLGEINEQLQELFDPDKSPAKLQDLASALKAKTAAVRTNVLDPNRTSKLIEAHANALMDMIEKINVAIDDSLKVSLVLKQAELALQGDNLNQNTIQLHENALKKLDDDIRNLNPLGVRDLNHEHRETTPRLNRLNEGISTIKTAYRGQADFQSLLAQGRDISQQEGGFARAFDAQAEVEQAIHLQAHNVSQWLDKGFAQPTDLQGAQQQINAWRSGLAGAALGLSPQQQSGCSQVLSKLGDRGNAELIESLKPTGPENLSELLQSLEAIENTDRSSAQNALDGFVRAKQTLGEGNALAQSLTQALHAGQLEVINKHQDLMAVHQNLGAIYASDTGAKLYQLDGKSRPEGDLDARAFLHMLMRFTSSNVADSNFIVGALSKLQTTDPRQEKLNLEQVALNADLLAGLNHNELQQLKGFTNVVCDKKVSPIEAAILEKDMQAQALVQVISQQIVPGANAGIADPQVQAEIRRGAELKDPNGVAEFNSVTEQLLEKLKLKEIVSVSEKDMLSQLEKSAVLLKELIGFKGTTEKLIDKVRNDPELQKELSIVLHLYHQVSASDGSTGRLEHKFSSDALRKEAKEFITYKKASGEALTKVPETTQKRLEERNKRIAEFETIFGKHQDDKAIDKAIGDGGKKRFITAFAYEKRAHQALLQDSPAERRNQSAQEQRILIEGTAIEAIESRTIMPLLRTEVFGDGNINVLRERLQTAYQKRLEVIQELIGETDTNGTFNAGNSSYLISQLESLRDKIPTKDDLQKACREAQSGQLVHIGQLFKEADIANGLSKAEIKTAYQAGMYQASLENLKWFDPKTLQNERPGFLGRIIFRLMGRGQRLPRILQRNDLQAINESIAKIAKNSSSQQQLLALNAQLTKDVEHLEKIKDGMVKDPQKLILAYQLLAVEQLGHKSDSKNPSLTNEDMAAIKSRWEALFPQGAGGVGQKFFDVVSKLPIAVGDNLTKILSRLGEGKPRLLSEVTTALKAIQSEQQEVSALHQLLKSKMEDLPFDANNSWLNQSQDMGKAMLGAGLGQFDLQTVLGAANAKEAGKESVVAFLASWKQAREVGQSGNIAEAIRLGRMAKHEMTERIKDLQQQSGTYPVHLERLRDQLEENLLNALPNAPVQTLTPLSREEFLDMNANNNLDEAHDMGEFNPEDLKGAMIESSAPTTEKKKKGFLAKLFS